MDQIAFNAAVYARDVYDKNFGIVVEKDDQKCILVDDEQNNTLYVTFRGSYNLKNWERDFTFIPVNRSYAGYVHKGFADALETILPSIRLLITYKFKDRKLVVSGHSLGGAVAQLFGIYFLNRKPMVVTMGCPKLYNRFSSVMKPSHIRIANSDDPVPKPLGLMYKHFQTEYVEINDHDLFASKVLNVEGINPFDHSSERYISKLQKMYPQFTIPTL